MESIAGYILVGGKSRRMGRDKWQLTLDGHTFDERIAGRMSAVTPYVTVVGNDAAATESHLPSAPDIYPEWGALGGVHAALSACPAAWALVVACDFPFVTGG